MSANDLKLVADVVGTLRANALAVWVFGGWAEELRGVRQAGSHADIDLLLRAVHFDRLES